MIYITGDTHGDIDIGKINTKNFPLQAKLTRDDYLIILGDFGAVWTGDRKDDYLLKWHENKPYTTLFIGGNHENYAILDSLPVQMWKGGKVHQIRPHILHLMNGQIFILEKRSIFTMGGATSHDKEYRRIGVSWWPGEEPTDEAYQDARYNLAQANNQVDVILSHTIPKRAYQRITSGREALESRVESYLDSLIDQVSYQKWYAGHLHQDILIEDYQLQIMYQKVDKL